MRKALSVLFSVLAAVWFFGNRAGASDVIYSCAVREQKIALTFDDGPHPTRTDEILDILREYHVKATFFLVGENAEWYPEIVEREAREGHELGNHSYSHVDLKKADYPSVCSEIDRCERAIWENFEYRPHLLRPPGGCYGDALVKAAHERDYTLVCWSVDTRDWAHTPVDVIVKKVLENAGNGDILLFHDYIAGDSPTPQAL
ncbi:MAG: polysaccharide deacetylase family protein, partial [Clostridia bacterium]|nr:polysaccharide deacetylase family protein [Clostridia bacterium]